MAESANTRRGSVATLRRYPVKSMMGEELNSAFLSISGLLGDRAYAVVDNSDGKVATAKNPRKWPTLFQFHAAFAAAPKTETNVPPVSITLPDGTIVSSDQSDIHKVLSMAFSRPVRLDSAGHLCQRGAEAPRTSTHTAEEYWPDIEGLDYRDTVTDFGLPEGTFFDAAAVHVLTTATLDQLRALYPQGRFEVRRFRPNVVIATANGQAAFVENSWVGRTLAVGDEVRLSITGPCPRCVMTTLAQGDLPQDAGVLRAAAQHNHAHVGVYASVLRGGTVRRGDSVTVE